MTKLYSYVVHHDHGFAPNPHGGFCTLAKCKFGTKKRNIIELAEKNDWIAGTGGANSKISAGHGKLLYAMRVDDKITLTDYCNSYELERIDAKHENLEKDRFALISNHFFYFGKNAIDVSEIPTIHLDHPFEKSGPGHRSDFSEEFVNAFAKWLKNNFKVGVHGDPCKPHSELKPPRSPTKVRRKGCTA